MSENPRIWALLDERQGNTSQTLGVAQALQLPFETKNIRFNRLIKLPNLLLQHHLWGVTTASRTQLVPPWPDLVIATGRRLSTVASYIKRQHSETFIAQIQWPHKPYRQLDLIFPPGHDDTPLAPNIVKTIGAPHRVTPQLLQTEAIKWQDTLAPLPAPRFALLLGGATKTHPFTMAHAVELATKLSAIVKETGGSLMITTSRRTDRAVIQTLATHLDCPHYLHRWVAGSTRNPYYAMLGLADVVVVTGDSVSMCSEACSTGKPVYIFAPQHFVTARHQLFHETLYAQGYAKPFSELASPFFVQRTKLQDTEFAAQQILQHCTKLSVSS